MMLVRNCATSENNRTFKYRFSFDILHVQFLRRSSLWLRKLLRFQNAHDDCFAKMVLQKTQSIKPSLLENHSKQFFLHFLKPITFCIKFKKQSSKMFANETEFCFVFKSWTFWKITFCDLKIVLKPGDVIKSYFHCNFG